MQNSKVSLITFIKKIFVKVLQERAQAILYFEWIMSINKRFGMGLWSLHNSFTTKPNHSSSYEYPSNTCCSPNLK